MRWRDCTDLIASDVWRVYGRADGRAIARAALTRPASRFLLVHRVGTWARADPRRRPVALLCGLLYRRWSVRYGLEIPFPTTIGPGLNILHIAGGIVINQRAVIGANCTLSQGVTIGGKVTDDGPRHPVLGSDVRVLPGAKIVGGVRIGDRVDIGANAVVTKDVDADTVVAGVPAVPVPGSRPQPTKHGDWPGGARGIPRSH